MNRLLVLSFAIMAAFLVTSAPRSAVSAEVGESALALAQTLGGKDQASQSAWLRELLSLAGRAALEDADAAQRSLFSEERLTPPAEGGTIEASLLPDPVKAAVESYLNSLAPKDDGLRSAILERLNGLYSHPADLPASRLDDDPAYRAALRSAALTVQERSDARVYNGLGAQPNQFQSVVAIVDTRDQSLCTGTLISPRHVLTAAHCVCRRNAPGFTREASDFSVVFGTVSTAADSIPVSGIDKMARCQADGSASHEDGDLALLKLARRASPDHDPVSLVEKEALPRSREAVVIVGFGLTKPPNVQRGHKNFAQVLVVSPDCRGGPNPQDPDSLSDADHYWCHPDIEMVAGGNKRRDACKGDSGGPVFVGTALGWENGKTPTRLRLAAITSRFITNGHCGDGSVYVRITDTFRQTIQAWLEH